MLIIFYFLFSFILLFSFFSILFWSLKNGITPSPTSKKQRKALFKLLEKHVPKNMEGPILELGSGFFPLAFQAAKLFPKNKVIAYETSFVPYFVSKVGLYLFQLKNLEIKRQDFFKVSFQDAGMLLCYLYPKAMEKLKKKCEEELKDGAYIVSNTFAFPDEKPVDVMVADDLYKTKIYLYVK